MAQLNEGRVDIISRDDGVLLSQANGGYSHEVTLTRPSVVRINGTRAMVASYEREGNDLILHMQDGTTVRYRQFFFEDVDGDHSELVFDDGVNPPEHALFPMTAEATDATTALAMTPEYESLSSIEPLLLAGTDTGTGVMTAAGFGALGVLGAIVGVAANAGGGGGGGDDAGGGGTAPLTPVISINPFAGDNVLDVGEKNSAQTLSGTTTNVEAGQTVTIVLGGVTYTTTVGADGSWSISVPPAALQALAEGTSTITVTVSNSAGTQASGSVVITVNGDAAVIPTIGINDFAEDNVLDAGEKGSAQTLSGTTTNVEAGQTVTIVLGGVTYTTTVGADGSWSISVPPAALQALADGTSTITATVSNSAGTQASGSLNISVEPTPVLQPTIALDDFAGDNVLSGAEKQIDQTLSGTTTNVEAGRTVTITLGNAVYSAVVQSDGSWSVNVPAAALAALADGTATITASVSNAAGTVVSASETLTVQPNNTPSIALEPLSGDGYLNGTEAGQNLEIGGTTSGITAGSIVIITLNNKNYVALVNPDGSWSATVSPPDLALLAQGPVSVTVSTLDSDGNTVSSSGQLIVMTTTPDASIDPPFGGDTTLNGAEAGVDQTLTGNTGATGPGQTVVVTVGGTDYPATVGTDGSWSVTIPADDLANLPQGNGNAIVVEVTDPAGNTNSSTTPIVVDTLPPDVELTGPVSGDGYLNAVEQGLPLTISGSGEEGATIVVTLNGNPYTTTVTNGAWSVEVPAADVSEIADGDYNVTITATDTAGNTTTITSPLTVIADPANLPSITVTAFAGDNVLDGAEQQTQQFVTGTSSNVQQGQVVTITFGGNSYTGEVQASGSWSVAIPASALAGLTNGSQSYTVSVSDAAGNPAGSNNSFTVDTTLVAIALDPISGDGYLNALEAQTALSVSGTSSNLPSGSTVTVAFGGTNYTANVGPTGVWSFTVPATALQNLPEGPLTVTATAPGAAPAQSTLNVAIAPLPQPVLDTPFGDGTLNNAEAQTVQTLEGSTGITGDGQQVTVTLGGINYPATVDDDGNWSVDIPATALQNLNNGTGNIVVKVTDAAGNTSSSTTPIIVDKVNPTISIEPVAVDNRINATEQDQPLLVEGQTKAGSTVTVTLNGVPYPATVDADGYWSATIPASVLQGLNDGSYNVTVAVTDSAGNTNSQTTAVTLLTATPAFTLAPVAGDGWLNSTEAGQPLTVNGTGTFGDTVTVTLHGKTYTTTVDNTGSWSVEVPTSDLATLANGSSYTVGVTVSDVAGNSSSQQATLAVDTSAPAATLNPIAGDGVLNATEQDQPLVINGTGSAGATVTVTLNGEDYVVEVGQNGQWAVTIPAADLGALNDTSYPVTVVVSDAAGNTTPINTTLVVNTAAPALSLNTIDADGTINATEQGQPLPISGTGNAGDTITVTLNGVNYTTTVGAGNTWSLNIPASALQAIDDGQQQLTVTATNSVGNTTSAPPVILTFDTAAPALTVGAISGDGYLSQVEAGSALIISGTGDSGDGIVVTFNNVDYPATVVNGQWSVEIPSTVLAGVADGAYTVSVTATDSVGNTSTVTSPLTVVADPANQPTITIDINAFAGDGTLDGAEQTEDQLVLGGTTNVEAGRTVTVTLGSETFTGVVQSGGVWSVVISATAFAGLTNGTYTIAATVTDRAGNPASDEQDFTVNNTDPAVSIGIISDDNYLNADEAADGITINGSSINLLSGTAVTVNFNGNSYVTQIGSDGKWSINVAASELTGLADGPLTVTASALDSDGNTVSASHTLTVVINDLPEATLNTPFGDSFLSADEMESAQTLTGSTGVAGDGQSVTVNIGGIDYEAEIDALGNWSVSIPASALQSLADGSSNIVVTVSDAAGNTDTLTAPFTVDTAAPQITVNPVAGDGLINASEQGQDLLVRGTAEAGGTVTVTLNGVDYPATVLLNGSWTATIPASVLQGLADGKYDLTITATDAAGNSDTALAPFELDTGAPAFTLGAIAVDGTLNATEQGQPLAITGTGTVGDTVSVTLNGNTYTGTVGSNGQWSVSVPASDLGALTNGSYPVSVTVSDAAGNSTSQQSTLAVDVTPPAVTISSPSGNGILSTEEQGQPLSLSGSGESGNIVTVTLNGKTYQATVGVNGQWTLEVPATDLAALSEGEYPISVTARDAAGNTTTTESSITLDNTQPTLTVNTAAFAGNGVVDGAELQLDQVLSGTTSAQPGQTVTVTVNGGSYTGLVQSDGSWQVTIPAGSMAGQTDGSHNLTVSVSNAQGNSVSTSGSYTINTAASSLAIAPLSGDGYLSAAEAQQPLLISGQTTNVTTGSTVQVTVNNVTYTGLVTGDGSWTVSVPAGALTGVADGTLTVSATVNDATGTPVTTTAPLNVLIATQPNATLNTPFGDGVLNAADVGSDGTLTGSTGITGAGQSVSVNIGGTDYTGTVANDGSWSITIPSAVLQGLGEGDTNFTVTVTDVAGNTDSASGSVRVDTESPALLVDTLAGDGIVNLTEKGQPLEVSGTGEIGATITVNFNGTNYTTTVGGGGSWSLDIPQSAIGGLADGSYSLQVTATDPAGNSTQQTGSFTVKADASVLPSISVNAFAGNNIVDGAEQQTAQLLSGTTTNVEAGQQVTITLGSSVYTALVQASGAWSVEIPAADLLALNNGTVTFNVAVTDVAGNSASGSLSVAINNQLSGLSVDVISTDGYLNATEAASDLTISGTSANVPQGSTITVQFNNQTFTTTVGANGVWSLVVPAASVAGLPDGVAQINVSAVDAASNPVSSSGTLNVHVNDLPVATIQPPFGDSYLSSAEAAGTQVLRGSTGVSGDGQTVNINIGGVDYSGVVDSSGNWTLSLPASVLQGLTAGDSDVVVTVTDAAGNTSNVTAPITVDFSAPTLTIGAIAGDGLVNAAEAQAAITVAGTTTAEEGQVVTITLNGQTYTATVGATGGWTLDLPAGALAGISNGSYTLTATVTDAAGNPVTQTSTVTVATALPQPTIDTPFTDGYLNSNDALSTQTLEGTTGLTGSGQTVVITIDGDDYTVNADADGNWTLDLEASTLQGLSEGIVPITVTVTDAAGNSGSASSTVNIDFTAPALTIASISGDDFINAAESLQSVAITGTASASEAGQTVTVTFNGQTYQTQVQSGGSWSVNLPATALQGLADGSYTVSASLTDQAGNITPASRTVTLDASAANLPTVTIDATLAGDNYINQSESGQSLTVSGTSTNIEVGRTITVTLNGETTTALVVAGGGWTAIFDASVVGDLSDGAHVITATATDAAQNPASASHTVTVVAGAAVQPTISINEVAGDDIITAQEANDPLVITGSSQRIPANSTIEVTLNNQTYLATVDANGNWRVEVPAADVQNLPQDSNTITATGEDVAGNVAEATHDFTVDTIPPLLTATLDVGTDGILNLAEALAGLVIGGQTDPGLTVTLVLNAKTYTAVADNGGVWSVDIPAGDLLQLADGNVEVGLSVTDSNGNTTTDVLDFDVQVNTLPALTLLTPFTDGVLNAIEASTDQVLTGVATNLAVGTAVTVNIGGVILTGEVTAGNVWSVDIPAGTLATLLDGTVQIDISATDNAGNPATVTSNLDVVIRNLPVAAILTPFGDGALNAIEAATDQVLQGTTGITGAGQSATLSIGNQEFAVTVDEYGNWSATLTSAQLLALGNGTHTIELTVSDRFGNEDTDTLDFNAILTGLPQPTLDTPFTDGIINAVEAAAGGVLTGETGIATPLTGQERVSVSLNGVAYPATIDLATGEWSLTLSDSLLLGLQNGSWPLSVTVTDSAGNVVTIDDSITVATTLPAPTINLPFGDGALNIAEAVSAQIINGKTGVTGAGQAVSVEITNGTGTITLPATVDNNGNWSLSLSPTQLATLTDGTHTITVTATDAAQNTNTANLTVTTALTPPNPEIDTPFVDGILSISEAAAGVTLTGRTGVSGLNQGVQLKIDVNGITYTGTVDSNGEWSVTLPAGALSGLTTGSHTINVTVTDSAGNTNTDSLTFNAALTAPTVTVDLPFVDGYVNAAEALNGGVLTGTTTGQNVTVTINNVGYPASVDTTTGIWSLNVAGTVLAALGQGTASFSVSASDSVGNTSTATGSFNVDTESPTTTLVFSAGGTLDYLESLTTQTLSGVTTGAPDGSVVTINVGTGTPLTAVVNNNSWSITLTPTVMQQLGATGVTGTISVQIKDAAGNTGTNSLPVIVDLTLPPDPLVTLAPVGGDNIINVADGSGTITLSGTYANLGALGGNIVITVNGVALTTVPVSGDSGTWNLIVPGTTFVDGTATVVTTVTALEDLQTATTTTTVLVDRVAPTVTIDAFATDNILNSTEAAAGQTISGTASISDAGRVVTVTLGGKTHTAVVQANGTWSTLVPAADLQALGQDGQTITANLTDAAGNAATEATRTITVDTGAPLLEVDALLGDNVITAADILLTQTLTGTVTGAQQGQTVGLYLGDSTPIATGIVGSDGKFSINLTPQVLGSLTDGTLVFGVRVSDAAGNQTDATLTVNKVVNSALSLVVDSVFGDGFLSAADTLVAQTISGITTSAGSGATVSLTLGGTTLSAAVGQDGKWAIVVPPSLLQLLDDGTIPLALTVTDAYGNTAGASTSVTAIIDSIPVIGSLTNLLAGNNLLNIAEAAVDQVLTLPVTAATGSTVTVTLGTKAYQASLANGSWTVTIPSTDLSTLPTGNLSLGVSVVDPAGNTSSSAVSVGIFTATPTITLNPIFGDGILNIADLATGQVISGVVNNVAAGTQINLTIGGSTVTATVGQNGAFSTTVGTGILGSLTNGTLSIGASLVDAAGNTATAAGNLVVDVIRPVVTLTSVLGDGLLNATEALLTQTITGTVTGAEAGSKVVVTIGGQQFITTTTASGFTLALTPAQLQGLLDGNLTVSVAVTDSAGNTGTASAGVVVGIHNLPTITLDPLFGDGALSLVESLVTQTITGTVANVAAGSVVNINIGNITATATVGSNGRFTATLTPDILGTLLSGNLTVGVSVTDTVGNTTSVSTGVKIGIANTPTLTMNTVFGDGVLNAADLNSTQTISGTSTNLPAGTTVTVTLGGKTYTALVATGGAWSVTVSKADLALLSDGTLTATATATDAYGNVATQSGSVSVISHAAPTVTLGTLFGDGALNAVEALSAQTVSGTSTNAEGSTVTLRIGTLTLTGTVAANGSWSISVPSASLLALADGTQAVSVSVTNAAGNTGSVSGSVLVGTHTTPTVAMSTIFGGDGYLNLTEASGTQTISGTSTNAVGGTVSVNVAGTVLTTIVASNGTWSISVPSTTLKNISDGSHTVSVTVSDRAGNATTTSSTFTAKTHDLPLVGVDIVGGNILGNVLSLLTNGLTVSGSTRYLAQGTTVYVSLDGTTRTATVDANGRYSVKFAGNILSSLNVLGPVVVTATDVAGNLASTTTTLALGSLLPLATTAAAAVATFSVAADESTSVDTSSLATTSSSEDSTSVTATVATASTTEESATTSDTSTSSSATTESSNLVTEESDTATTTEETTSAVADDSSYSIGGLMIVLADGTIHEGQESVTGSSGDDTITLTSLDFTHIDGGAGTDTLVLGGENMTLDLTTLGLDISSIEVLDLGTSGTNTLKLDLSDALKLTDKQGDDLIIRGGDGNQVMLANTDGGVWSNVGQRTVDGQQFDVYHNSALTSDNTLGDVLIQHNLQVHVV